MFYSLNLNLRRNKIFVVIFCLCTFILTSKTIAQNPDSCVLTVLSSDGNLGSVRSYSRSGSLITSMPNNTSVNFSGTAELIAIPQAGKIFVGWSDNVLNNPRTVEVSQDATFTAIFDDCETVNIDGITENPIYFKIYPNRVIDNLTVEVDVSAIGGMLEIFTVAGTRLLQQVISNQQEIISMQNFASGIYFITLSFNGMVLGNRVLVLH